MNFTYKTEVSMLIIALGTFTLSAQRLPFNFDARALLVLSDADMAASAYVDGILHTEPGVYDALTAIQIDSLAPQWTLQKLPVPNSVTNWPKGMALSLDHKTAFVVDTRGGLPRNVQQTKDLFHELPPGKYVRAIDISDPERLREIAHIQVPELPLAVDVHPQTGQLLVVSRSPGKEIALIDWTGNSFGQISVHDLALGTQVTTYGQWHPSGNYFSVTIESLQQVAFYRLTTSHGFEPLGDPVSAGSFPGATLFSKNGQYCIVSDLKWDRGYNLPGALLAIRFDAQGKHQVVAEQSVGISPESFAISPDGKSIVVANMGTNYMPIGFVIFGEQATMSLLSFDEQTGQFLHLDTQPWEGILPEGIVFDRDGDMFAVTSYDYLDLAKARRGGVHFWAISSQEGKPLKLQNTGFSISLTRGAHYLQIIP